jgi:hypothetical protein
MSLAADKNISFINRKTIDLLLNKASLISIDSSDVVTSVIVTDLSG